MKHGYQLADKYFDTKIKSRRLLTANPKKNQPMQLDTLETFSQ